MSIDSRTVQLSLSISWVVISSTFFFILLALLCIRRKHSFLKARSVNLMALTVFGCWASTFYVTTHDIVGDKKVPCFSLNFARCTCGYLAFAPDIGRALKLLCIHFINKKKLLELRNIMNTSYPEPKLTFQRLNGRIQPESGCNHDNNEINFVRLTINKITPSSSTRIKWASKLTTERYLLCGYTLFLGLHVLIYLVVITVWKEERAPSQCVTNLNQFSGVSLLIFYSLALYIGSFCIRNIREEFDVKKTICVAATFCVIGSLGFIVWEMVPVFEKVRRVIPGNAWLSGMMFLHVCSSIAYPILQSYYHQPRSILHMDDEELMRQPVQHLEKVILETKDTLELFQRYCELEFSSENIYFYLDVKSYEEASRAVDALAYGQLIMQKYVLPGAIHSINILEHTRTQITDRWQEIEKGYTKPMMRDSVPKDLFSKAQAEVKKSIVGTFYRFTQSRLWKEYEQHIQEEKQVLIRAGLL